MAQTQPEVRSLLYCILLNFCLEHSLPFVRTFIHSTNERKIHMIWVRFPEFSHLRTSYEYISNHAKRDLQSFPLSGRAPHEVLKVQGLVVTQREASSGREYKTHHDRLSNPMLSNPREAQDFEKDELPSSNPTENVKEPEPDADPIGDSSESFLRTRYSRTI